MFGNDDFLFLGTVVYGVEGSSYMYQCLHFGKKNCIRDDVRKAKQFHKYVSGNGPKMSVSRFKTWPSWSELLYIPSTELKTSELFIGPII